MAVDERSRHVLFESLERALGPAAGAADAGHDAVDASGAEPADTLMSYLPATGWADVATVGALADVEQRLDARIDGLGKQLDGVERRLDARIDGVERRLDARIDGLDKRLDGIDTRLMTIDGRFDQLHASISSQTRTMMFTGTGVAISFGGLIIAAARLL